MVSPLVMVELDSERTRHLSLVTKFIQLIKVKPDWAFPF